MIDGIAFVSAMKTRGMNPAGRRVLLVGAGGVGAAIAYELMRSGVDALADYDTNENRSDALVERLHDMALSTKMLRGSWNPQGFDIVINGTPLGIKPDDALPVDMKQFEPGMAVADVVSLRQPHCYAMRNRGVL
ncbi:hypothetical protein [Sphingobium phenoxybenzoativorans]|uniref:hypothetical protein n=1 Tax=Sphingobium phenoxybenzoativorans TaxID=1592790 RepID=UPI00087223DF|nr:hypothetical protein [Sphingobium phenoxybenzoativorans]